MGEHTFAVTLHLDVGSLRRPTEDSVTQLERTSSTERARIAARAADDKKGEDIVVLDVAEIIGIVDVFVIAHASNTRLVRTIVEEVKRQLLDHAGVKPRSIEGLDDMSWVLLDYGDVLVHVFRARLVGGEATVNAPSKISRLSWHDPGSLPEPMSPTARTALVVERMADSVLEMGQVAGNVIVGPQVTDSDIILQRQTRRYTLTNSAPLSTFIGVPEVSAF